MMIWLVLEPINSCLSAFQALCLLFVCIEVSQQENPYQQLIAYIGAILCLIIMLLLIWGLKYYKK
ncbi:immunity protein BlpL [Streptococcus pneumoniae]|nr:immunity protein BlpL [Streptococcus pneumoniae]